MINKAIVNKFEVWVVIQDLSTEITLKQAVTVAPVKNLNRSGIVIFTCEQIATC